MLAPQRSGEHQGSLEIQAVPGALGRQERPRASFTLCQWTSALPLRTWWRMMSLTRRWGATPPRAARSRPASSWVRRTISSIVSGPPLRRMNTDSTALRTSIGLSRFITASITSSINSASITPTGHSGPGRSAIPPPPNLAPHSRHFDFDSPQQSKSNRRERARNGGSAVGAGRESRRWRGSGFDPALAVDVATDDLGR